MYLYSVQVWTVSCSGTYEISYCFYCSYFFIVRGEQKGQRASLRDATKWGREKRAQKKFNAGRNWFSLQVMWSNTLQQCCCTLFKRDRSALIDRLLNICLQSIYAHGALWCISLRPQIRDLSNLYVQINIVNDFFSEVKQRNVMT